MRYAKHNSSSLFAAMLIVFGGGTMISAAIDTQVTDPASPAVAPPEDQDPFGGANNDPGARNICGGIDNRVTSRDRRVGRLTVFSGANCSGTSFPFCTAWLVSNGSLVTAGHCVDNNADGQVDLIFQGACVEFNVSSLQTPGHTSTCNGTPMAAPADHVYQVVLSSVRGNFNFDRTGLFNIGVLGSDYAVFSVSPNLNTGRLPAVKQGAFFRVTQVVPDDTDDVRVTGCGIDEHPNGCGGGPCPSGNCNADSRTIQTETGGYRGEQHNNDLSLVWHEYRVDTQGASSGSPIIWEGANQYAIGAHTTGGCAIAGIGSNLGTSFRQNNFASALDGFLGPNTVHVDTMSMAPTPDGSIFAPYLDLQEALDKTPVGGQISIVSGYYATPILFDKEVMVLTPVGSVTIGY